MNKYYTCFLLIFCLLIVPHFVFGQSEKITSENAWYIQTGFLFDAAFFLPSSNRIDDLDLKDHDQFLVYGIGFGFSRKSFSIGMSFSFGNDIEAFNNPHSQPIGYRYFDSFNQLKLSVNKVFHSFNLKDNTQLSLGGSTGVLYNRYKGHESLGYFENYASKQFELEDVFFSFGLYLGLIPKGPISLTFQPLGVNFGFKATTYEVGKIGLEYNF